MKTIGTFETLNYSIQCKRLNEPVNLTPVSDCHFGAEGFARDKWRHFKDRVVQSRKQGNLNYFVGVGDYMDATKTSDRKAVAAANLSDSFTKRLEDAAHDQLDEVRREFEFMRPNLIGLGVGNHGWVFQDGQNETQKLCASLGVPYLGICSVYRINLVCHGMRSSVLIYQHHGLGGSAQTAGGHINPVERMLKHIDGVQIAIMGHDHSRGGFPAPPRLACLPDSKHPDRLRVKEVPLLLVRAGSFLRAYEPGNASYVIQGLMGPTSLGVVTITLTPRRTKEDGYHVEIGCIN